MTADEESRVMFDRPRIVVLDLPEISERLATAGYHVSSGTLGQPVIVPREAGFRALTPKPVLPFYSEQEIVIANLASPRAVPLPADAAESPPDRRR
jgi:hypothetical protein